MREVILYGTPVERYRAIEHLRETGRWSDLAELACDDTIEDELRLQIIESVSRPAPEQLLVATARRLCTSPVPFARLQGLVMCSQHRLRALIQDVEALADDVTEVWQPVNGGHVLVEIATHAADVAALLRDDRAHFGLSPAAPATDLVVCKAYHAHRDILLACAATDLAALIIENRRDERVITVAVVADGTVHVGFSDMGWGGPAPSLALADAVAPLWQWARYHACEATPVNIAALPSAGCVAFHFVHSGAVRSYAAELWTLQLELDRMARLFHLLTMLYAVLGTK